MRRILKCGGYSLLTLSLLLSGISIQAEQSRISTSAEENVSVDVMGENARTVLFNDDWKFKLGTDDAFAKDFNDTNWRKLDLPHDWSIEQDFTVLGEAESGFLLGGTGWYRKSFAMPEKYDGKRVVIDFDGVYMNAEVYVNGKKVGSHPYGYTAFAFDITDELTYDGQIENVIAVRVQNDVPSSRWYSGSGIYRDVTLTVTDPVHVDRNGTYVTTPNLEAEKDGDVTTKIQTTVRNDSESAANIIVKNTVVNDAGEAVSAPVVSEVSVDASSSKDIDQEANVNKPDLWSTENPARYRVETEVVMDGNVVDTYTSTFGYRYFGFDRDKGFALNGDNLKLQGVCMHHDQGALGAVANATAVERQVQKLKDMGCNAIRVTHNPASKALIEACDRLGMLMIDEAFDGWAKPKNGNTNDFSAHFNKEITEDNTIIDGEAGMTWAEFDAKAMVKNANNAPSIIMWSICNEVGEGSGTDSNYPTYARNIVKWIQEEDMTRPVTLGDNNTKNGDQMYRQISTIVAEAGGVVGLNYSFANQNHYQKLLDANPSWTIYGAETSSGLRSRGYYSTTGQDNTNLQMTAYDYRSVGWGQTAQVSWKDVITRDNVAGEFVWTGFDYIGEPTPWNGIGTGSVSGQGAKPKSSYFGILDTAGLEKDVYYFYQSQWRKDLTTLHMLPAWNGDALAKDASGNVDVVVYSNAPTVELFLNGTSLGKKNMTKQTTPQGHSYYTDASGNLSMTWKVKYAAGTLEVKAYDEDGTQIKDTSGRNSVTTTDKASKVELTADRPEIKADGKDLSYITVDVCDKDGNIVPNAKNKVDFEISGNGKIVGVDNGDATDTDSYKGTSRKVFSGKAVVIVQSDQKEGSFTVTAKSDGLTKANVTVNTKRNEAQDDVFMKSYKIAKHHYVNVGEKPTLPESVKVMFSNGDEDSYDVEWNTYDEANLLTPGVFKVTGTLKDTDVSVSVDVHVIGEISAMKNYSAFIYAGEAPKLPQTLPGITNTGTLSEEFPVAWDVEGIDWSTPGTYTVKGTADVVDKTMSVIATIRVVQALEQAINIALKTNADAPKLAESCSPTSDLLASINNGITNNGASTNERWTNWAELNAHKMAYITMEWANTYKLDKVDLYLFTDGYSAQLPEDVKFEYWNGSEYVDIPYSNTTPVSYTVGETTYLFNTPIETSKIRIGMLGKTGHCVGLTEAKVYNYVPKENAHTTAQLSSISLDGKAMDNFASDTYAYAVDVNGAYPEISVEAMDNAAVTMLPVYGNEAKIMVVSEDGKTTNTYTITFVKAGYEGLKGILSNTVYKAGLIINSDVFNTLAPVVKTKLQEAYDQANVVLDDQKATDKQVLDAWLALANAMHYAEFQANKAMLQTLYDQCIAEIDPDDYTEGVQEYKDALANALAVLGDENALQLRIDEAYTRLLAARDGLSSITVDKTIMKQIIDLISNVKEQASNYVVEDESWKNLMSLYDEAVALYNNPKATDQEVTTLTLKLASAYENIRLIPNEEMLKVLADFVNKVEAIDAAYYSADDYAYVMDAASKAKVMMMQNDFTVEQFNDMKATMNEANRILDENVLDEPVTPQEPTPPVSDVTDPKADADDVQSPNAKPEAPVKPTQGTTKTGDTTNMLYYSLVLAGAGAAALLASRRKKGSK